jgi:hypothetical protein
METHHALHSRVVWAWKRSKAPGWWRHTEEDPRDELKRNTRSL